jgi:hypothetical protein
MQRSFNFFFEFREFMLYDPVEIDQFPIGIVDDFNLRRRLGEQDCAAAAEWFAIQMMFGQEWKDLGDKFLLAAVICK